MLSKSNLAARSQYFRSGGPSVSAMWSSSRAAILAPHNSERVAMREA
jgi:hypothetical protein